MPKYDFRCTACETIQLDVIVPCGTRPPCPACGGVTEVIWLSSFPNVIGDDVPGGFWVENMTATPEKFYSKSAWRDRAASLGLRIRDESGPMPSRIRARWRWSDAGRKPDQ